MINSRSTPCYLCVVLLVAVLGTAGSCLQATQPSKQQEPKSTPLTEAPKVKLPTIVVFEANPTKITAVEEMTLRWEVNNADSINIDQGIGKVSSAGTKKLIPEQSKVYKLTASNPGGDVSRTVSVTVYNNTNASEIALNDNDLKSTGFEYRRNAEPAIPNTISTYSVTFMRRGVVSAEELLENSVYIYNTVAATEKRYIETKANARGNLPDIMVIGDEGYILKVPGLDVNSTTYALRFRKNNVFVNLGTLSDLKELQTFARIVETRIK